MLKHIVGWSFIEEFTLEKNLENAVKIKADLESLNGKIRGLVDIKVSMRMLSCGTDIVLDSTFANEEALIAYQQNEEHKKVAVFINSVTQNKKILDYYI